MIAALPPRRWVAGVAVILLTFASVRSSAASHHVGEVTFAGMGLPGATVTATRDDQQRTTFTDQRGTYRFASLSDGPWLIRVGMQGFNPVEIHIAVAPDAPPARVALTMRSTVEPTSGVGDTAAAGTADVLPSLPAPNESASSAAPLTEPSERDLNAIGGLEFGASEALLIDGSVNNAATSPFAQSAAFGNNRPGRRSLYTGGVGAVFGNSAWDARPFSFAGVPQFRPVYGDLQLLATFGGPLRIPRLTRRGPNIFLGYQRTVDHTTTTDTALVPSAAERAGDFSALHAAGLTILDPLSGTPFPGGIIPANRLSREALALLTYFPTPNSEAAGSYNYQAPLTTAAHVDNLQARVTQNIGTRNQVSGVFSYQRTVTDSTSLFAFADSALFGSGDLTVSWTRLMSRELSLRARYRLVRSDEVVTPHFAGRLNVSAAAGISGNDQSPENWGPPSLTFSRGLVGLTDASYQDTSARAHEWGFEAMVTRRRHFITIGGTVHRRGVTALGQPDARGGFGFTGAATGDDLADFLLGLPQTSTLSFDEADTRLRGAALDLYLNDTWRPTPGLTVNAGVRWEYEGPMSEERGRLVNLDIAPGFTAAAPVIATHPVGRLTGQTYPASLLRPDLRGIQPRVSMAWRPMAGSSVVVRASYGIYQNTGQYRPIALLLAKQPPLSTTFMAETRADYPLTLANGFAEPSPSVLGTFAVDPNFRPGRSQNWQLSWQRDLRGSLTVLATYLGSKGSRLMQEILPNTHPPGDRDTCFSCPSGFVYLTSHGSSNRQAAQLELRRRLRNGVSATLQYTVAKATDDAGAIAGVSLLGSAIAQDWRDPGADWGPSSFDQRHLLTAQAEYTTGMGLGGGALLDGRAGRLLKGWTFTSRLSTGSGLPLTPLVLVPVPGTSMFGTVRADLRRELVDDVPAGLFVNPAAYVTPASGHWGSAGRHSIRGPAPFALSAGLGRAFSVTESLRLDWRLDASNVINHVSFASFHTIVGSPQFGSPNRANTMRKLKLTVRLRF